MRVAGLAGELGSRAPASLLRFPWAGTSPAALVVKLLRTPAKATVVHRHPPNRRSLATGLVLSKITSAKLTRGATRDRDLQRRDGIV